MCLAIGDNLRQVCGVPVTTFSICAFFCGYQVTAMLLHEYLCLAGLDTADTQDKHHIFILVILCANIWDLYQDKGTSPAQNPQNH